MRAPLAAVVTAVVFVPSALGQCVYEQDAPDCDCFDDTGAWNPSGAWIQDVALATWNTQVSCTSLSDAGKPYYQMVLGCNSEVQAQVMAQIIWMHNQIGFAIFREREAWCSETISYWHRESGIPYPGGYETWWHPGWHIGNVGSLKSWYVTEESLDVLWLPSRGRWIASHEVDYEDFVLGETVPVPGSYVATRGFTLHPPAWEGLSNSHSQMIDEMWIHRDIFERVFRVEVTLLQGNSGTPARVRGGHWDDILAITLKGTEFLDGGRKIYGFGVDLDAAGDPVYDPSRLHYVEYAFQVTPAPLLPPEEVADADWDDAFGSVVSDLTRYAELVVRGGGPTASSSSRQVPVEGIPDGRGTRWSFPAPLPEPVDITVDLLAVHPVPIRGIELFWSSASLPRRYEVRYAGEDMDFRAASVPDLRDPVLPGPGGIEVLMPVTVRFSQARPGVLARYVQLAFAADSFRDAASLAELRFVFEWGPWEDAPAGPAGGEFRRGFVNPGRELDIADAVCLLGFLFGDEGDPCKRQVRLCLDAGDANDDGEVDIGDAIKVLGHLFAGTGPLPPPFEACGYDRTYDELRCSQSPSCQ